MSDKKIFVEGAITPSFIADSIAKHQSKHTIGAHNIFLGQVRADEFNGKKVTAIEYSTYTEMALPILSEIRERTFATYSLTCMHIYHSLGLVKTGEICLFVFVSAPRRSEVYAATEAIVEWIKKEVPIFGKEILEDSTHSWKVNS